MNVLLASLTCRSRLPQAQSSPFIKFGGLGPLEVTNIKIESITAGNQDVPMAWVLIN